jgi:hypothetical protein
MSSPLGGEARVGDLTRVAGGGAMLGLVVSVLTTASVARSSPHAPVGFADVVRREPWHRLKLQGVRRPRAAGAST